MTLKRATVSFTDEDIQRLDELKKALGLKSTAQTISMAIRYTDVMVHQAQEGRSLISRKNGNEKEIIFPGITPIANTD